jgi:hypothetical protein
MIAPQDLLPTIVERLAPSSLADRLAECTDGDCKSCGDVCPNRANNWRQRHAKNLRAIFADPSLTAHEMHLSCSAWHKKPGELNDINARSIFKTVRRTLDRLRNPEVVAVGLLDAAWSGNLWKVGITVFVLLPRNTSKLNCAFNGVKYVDYLEINCVHRAYSGLYQLMRAGQHAKLWPIDGRMLLKHGPCREYYRWLAQLKAGERVFRYGCDHHFNVRHKSLKPITWRLPKRRRPADWLEPYRYGSHEGDCPCSVCRARQNH